MNFKKYEQYLQLDRNKIKRVKLGVVPCWARGRGRPLHAAQLDLVVDSLESEE